MARITAPIDRGKSICRSHSSAAGSVLAIAHGRSMARITAPAVLGESALLAALSGTPAKRPLTYRCAGSRRPAARSQGFKRIEKRSDGRQAGRQLRVLLMLRYPWAGLLRAQARTSDDACVPKGKHSWQLSGLVTASGCWPECSVCTLLPESSDGAAFARQTLAKEECDNSYFNSTRCRMQDLTSLHMQDSSICCLRGACRRKSVLQFRLFESILIHVKTQM